MDFSVKIEGLEQLAQSFTRVREAVAAEINKAVYVGAQKISTEAKKSIASGDKSGRLYTRRTVTHRASAPGEAPASDTGRLINSINANVVQAGEAEAVAGSSAVKYARMLEFGTTKMAARPFFFPAFEKSKQWIRERIQDALRRGIEAAGK